MSEQQPKMPKRPGYIFRRLKLGFRRTARQWQPFRRYGYKKEILHNKRVFHTTPNIINILLIGLFIVFVVLQLYDKNIYSSNPLFFFLFLFLLIILLLLEFWYAGSEDYLKHQ